MGLGGGIGGKAKKLSLWRPVQKTLLIRGGLLVNQSHILRPLCPAPLSFRGGHAPVGSEPIPM